MRASCITTGLSSCTNTPRNKLSSDALATLSVIYSGTSDSDSSQGDPNSRRFSSSQRACRPYSYLETEGERVESTLPTTRALDASPLDNRPDTGGPPEVEADRPTTATSAQGNRPSGSPRLHKSGTDSEVMSNVAHHNPRVGSIQKESRARATIKKSHTSVTHPGQSHPGIKGHQDRLCAGAEQPLSQN